MEGWNLWLNPPQYPPNAGYHHLGLTTKSNMTCVMIKYKRPDFRESTLSFPSILNRQSQIHRAFWILLITSSQSLYVAERCQLKYRKYVTISRVWTYALETFYDPPIPLSISSYVAYVKLSSHIGK